MTTPVTFEEAVKLRLKDVVRELIPEDRWDALVRSTIADFERVELPKLIKIELEAKYRQVIAEEFNKPEWSSTWQNGRDGASENLRKLLIEAAPEIFASMMSGAMQATLMDLQTKLQQPRYY